MTGQKQAVVNLVILYLPNFNKFMDRAILLLTNDQLEAIKNNIHHAIVTGTIEYSKDRTNIAEVKSYARSMVMNHLKKAKELNGGHAYKSVSVGITGDIDELGSSKPSHRIMRVKEKIAPKGVDVDLLPAGLAEYVKTLV